MSHSINVTDREREHHDKLYDEIRQNPIYFEEARKAVNEYASPLCYEESRYWLLKERMLDHLGEVEGKKALIMGSGVDCSSLWFAAQGCDTTVIDISKSAIETQERLAKLAGVRIKTIVDDANLTQFDDGSFDLIYGTAILHHLDSEKAAREIYRLLRPGGRAVFRDVMRGGISIRIFRRFTPSVRTRDEHPLTKKDLLIYAQAFPQFQTEHFCYLAVPYLGFVRVWNGVWEKLLGKGKAAFMQMRRSNALVHVLDRMDKKLFRIFPFLKYHGAWLCIIVMRR